MYTARLKHWAWLVVALFLLILTKTSNAAITDGKFGINQIFDVQYYWSGTTLNASNFIAPYDKNFQTVTVSSGQYFQFFPSTTNPGTYGLGLYNSNGTLSKVVHDYGDITALGNGAIFYIGSGFFGNVISTAQGYNYGASASFANMDTTITSSDLNNYTWASTTPLAAGQTAAPPAPAYGTNFTRITSYEWTSYTAGSQPVGSEQAHEAFDDVNGSKWFGHRSQGAWVVVRLDPNSAQYSPTRAVQKIQFVTANDAAERDPTGFRIWGSINGTDWVLISEQAISLPAGRNAASSIYNLNNVTAFSYYKIEFTGTKSGGDAFQIAEIRLLYDVDDPQGTLAGGGVYTPPPLCCGGSAAVFNANSAFNSRIATFDARVRQDSNVIITQIGNYNAATVSQSGTRHNYSEIYVSGNSNTTNTTQTSNTGAARNYIELDVIGNNNSVNLTQSSTGGNKGILATINDNSNTLTVNQNNNGNHYAEITLSGSNKTVNLTQSGSAAHMAKIELSGGSTSLTATQSGSNQQFYSITHNCAQVSCSAITVNQGQ